jgi:predicted transposase/invertase (TIGR01784 family)
MQTDKIFHRLFAYFPEFFFELIGLPPETAQEYAGYQSEEVKALAFRLDGVLIPKKATKPLLFVEVQFQPDPDFYRRVFAEIFVYLQQHKIENEWKVVVIFPRKGIEPKRSKAYNMLFGAQIVHVIYLRDLLKEAPNTTGLTIYKLILAKGQQAIQHAKILMNEPSVLSNQDLFELIESVILYKFPTLSREEIQKMLDLGFDIKQTRFYQEAREEGLEKERLNFAEGLLELLADRFGHVENALKSKILSADSATLKAYYKTAWKASSIEDLSML